MTTQNKPKQDINEGHCHPPTTADPAFSPHPYPLSCATFDPVANSYRMIPDPQQYYTACVAYHHQMMMAYYTGHPHLMQQVWMTPYFGRESGDIMASDGPQQQFAHDISQQQLVRSNSLVETEEEEATRWIEERRRKYPVTSANGKRLAVIETEHWGSNQSSAKSFTTNSSSSLNQRHKTINPTLSSVAGVSLPDHDLAATPKLGNFRTKICRYFAKGRCDNGANCNFLHQSTHPSTIQHQCQGREKLENLLRDQPRLDKILHVFTQMCTK
jgi:hypothetical protein